MDAARLPWLPSGPVGKEETTMATTTTRAHLYQDGAAVEYGDLRVAIHTVMAAVAHIGDPNEMIGLTDLSRAICGKLARVYPREHMERSVKRYSFYRPCETCEKIAPDVAVALFR